MERTANGRPYCRGREGNRWGAMRTSGRPCDELKKREASSLANSPHVFHVCRSYSSGGRKGRPCEGDFSSKILKPKTYSLKPYSVYTRGTRLDTAQSSS